MIRVNKKVKRPDGTFILSRRHDEPLPSSLKSIVEYNSISLRFLNQEST